ncbi:Gfo/Idh/MocA family protein [Neorhizobium petrolearium]|uniref:Gfo/Idh/MocA family protein n=1 Tax=Neorhizobium petrolearium TaxID=515361 RepID=UPI003F160132
MKAVGWGIVGTGQISATVVEQIGTSLIAKAVAVSSRSPEKAQSFADRAGIAKAYGGLPALLEDSDVEAVYIGLPHGLHVDAVVAALDAGKHVLCEKPMGRTVMELRRIAEHPRAEELIVAEGFMLRHQPQWRWIEDALAKEAIGTVTAVHIHNALTVPRSPPDPTRIHVPGDGSLILDIGCYAFHLARTIFRAEPVSVSAHMGYDPGGHDTLIDATLRFKHGTAHITVATTLKSARRIHILGTDGNIEIFSPVHSPSGSARLLASLKGEDGPPKELVFPIGSQYGLQLEEFSRAIRQKRQPLVPLSNAIGNARVLDAVVHSASHSGCWAAP